MKPKVAVKGAVAKAAIAVAPPILAILLALASCAPAGPRLRIGLLPDAAALPFLLAESGGAFSRAGLSVELRMYASAAEAGADMAAGELDGCETDLLHAALSREADGEGAKIAFRCGESFGLAVAGDAGDAASLRPGSTIGVAQGGAGEWVLDLMLKKFGAPAKLGFQSDSDALGALQRGEIDAALLPWPLGFRAVRSGARIVADNNDVGVEPRVFALSAEILAGEGALRDKFLRALEEGRAEMAADAERARPLLGRIGLDGETAALVPIPAPGRYSAPAEEEIAMAQAWLAERGLLKKVLSYADLVAGAEAAGGIRP